MPAAPSSHDVIAIALAEDVGSGDLTAEFFVDSERESQGRIFAKQKCVLAGGCVSRDVFHRVDPSLAVELVHADREALNPGDTVLRLSGKTRSILTGERVALNFLQRLSGVATLTRRFVEAVGDQKARILDTRKTTPGLRAMEKAAVVAGGGVNHRFGLYDMVMVKDNHLAANADLGHLQQAISRLREAHPNCRVELEADRLEQVTGFLSLTGVDVILLDNMAPGEMEAAVQSGQGRVLFEASGGVNLETIARIAKTGVDYISVGALTHSVLAIDFSLELT